MSEKRHNIEREGGRAFCSRCGTDTGEGLCKPCPAISDGAIYATLGGQRQFYPVSMPLPQWENEVTVARLAKDGTLMIQAEYGSIQSRQGHG